MKDLVMHNKLHGSSNNNNNNNNKASRLSFFLFIILMWVLKTFGYLIILTSVCNFKES